MGTDEQKDMELEKLRQRFNKAPADLVINRVPEKELTWFKSWAKDEFCNDYGIAFKMLCYGHLPPENAVIIQKVEELEKKIKDIEFEIAKLSESKIVDEHTRKMGDGRIMRMRT